MSHFNKNFLNFFNELTKNNDRDWFKENKTRYEFSVKKPFEFFVEEMIHLIQEEDDGINITPKEAIFRIYRDVRFSKDKSPYKTHASAVISPGGRKDLSNPGCYIQLSSEDARFYMGAYVLDKDRLQKLREHIAANLEEFNSLAKDKLFKKYFGTLLGEKNKRIPKEFREIEKAQPLIANKQFYYFAKLDPDKILSKNFTNTLMKFYTAGRKMNDFIKAGMN